MKKSILLVVFILFSARILIAGETKVFKYDDHNRRDPFWSLVSPGGTIINYDNDIELNDLALQGVIAGTNGENLAIVNGRVLKLNDKIGDFQVTEINNDYIILKKGEQELLLKLKKGGM